MSSTNRGSARSDMDYYVTPSSEVELFLREWTRQDEHARSLFELPELVVLDPCAGGNSEPIEWVMREAQPEVGVKGEKGHKKAKPAKVVNVPVTPMSYPTALARMYGDKFTVDSMDIRENSFADYIGDFLTCRPPHPPDIIMGNPPFFLSQDFIKRGLKLIPADGYVVMLLRLNYYGTKARKAFFESHMPKYTFVHHERMSFLPDGSTDSIEYAHFVWTPAWKKNYSMTFVI